MFVRADILEWLKAKYRFTGPKGARGFHQCRALIADRMPFGHDADCIRREIGYLVQHGCIVAEHQKSHLVSDDDLLRITPSGYVHLSLLSDLDYLAACSEETWVEDETLARQVASRIAQFGPRVHYSPVTMAANAADFVKYLETKAKQDRLQPAIYLQSGFSGVSLRTDEVIVYATKQIDRERKKSGWDDFENRFAVGMECAGTVDGIKEYGCFVRLDGGPNGLLLRTFPPNDLWIRCEWEIGSW